MLVKNNFYIALAIAAFLDLADYLGGVVPIVGDVLDVIGIVLLFPLIGTYSLIGIAEFVPFVDFLPTFLGAVFAYKMNIGGMKKE